jgi:hypothetical protein
MNSNSADKPLENNVQTGNFNKEFTVKKVKVKFGSVKFNIFSTKLNCIKQLCRPSHQFQKEACSLLSRF